MKVTPFTQNITFCYKHQLKTLWIKGQLPSVRVGLYGDRITKQNISLEHIIPYSQNGKTELYNLALASCYRNNLRSDHPIKDYLKPKIADKYLEQFRDVKVGDIDGNKYIEAIRELLTRLGVYK